MDHNFPTGNSKINIPHFCSRNSGLVFEDIVGYRVYLGHCDKLPDTHFFIHWKSAQKFAQKQSRKKYDYVHIVIVVFQKGYYLTDPQGKLTDGSDRYSYFSDHRFSEWDIGYYQKHNHKNNKNKIKIPLVIR